MIETTGFSETQYKNIEKVKGLLYEYKLFRNKEEIL